jgi:hypothetical protein
MPTIRDPLVLLTKRRSQMSKTLPRFASLLFGAALALGLAATVQAAPLSYARSGVENATSAAPVVKTVTRAGVRHRSARRTTRRVVRRHHY